jgi:iron(III) transport system substrate-binding protein
LTAATQRYWLVVLSLLCLLPGCGSSQPAVTLYSDQERGLVEPLIAAFTQETGLPVNVVYAEARQRQEGEGLSAQIRRERDNPAVDLYWAENPDALQAGLESGLYAPIDPNLAGQIAEPFRAPNLRWIGLGLRVRVLVYNPKIVPMSLVPDSVASLIQPRWKGRGALADPRTNGSSQYHLMALFTLLGKSEGASFLERLRANAVQILPDETAVVEAVAAGNADWGIADSDVAEAAVRAGKSVRYVLPDQEAGVTQRALGITSETIPTLGTPLLPAPLALLQTRPHREEALKLLEYLASAETARKLEQLQPNRLPTHLALLRDSHTKRVLNPLVIQGLITDPAKVHAVRPSFLLAFANLFVKDR